MLVLDEADEMLNQGFREQIYDVYRYLPPSTQVVLVSATLTREGLFFFLLVLFLFFSFILFSSSALFFLFVPLFNFF